MCVYAHSIFIAKIRKIMYTPVNPNFAIKRWGLRGYTLHGHDEIRGPNAVLIDNTHSIDSLCPTESMNVCPPSERNRFWYKLRVGGKFLPGFS